jgi:hypothetical protein
MSESNQVKTRLLPPRNLRYVQTRCCYSCVHCKRANDTSFCEREPDDEIGPHGAIMLCDFFKPDPVQRTT